MVLFLDANLSWKLVESLKPDFSKVLHVENINLPQPTEDSAIWNYAKIINAIIVTNDDDFYKLAILKGFPPKLVILRTGNQATDYIADILIKHAKDIYNLYESKEYGILEII